MVFAPKPASRSKISSLRILIGLQRQGLDDIIRGSEIMEGAVTIAKNFDGHGRVADVFAVGLDFRPRGTSVDRHEISNRAVRSPFYIGRQRLTSSKKAGCDEPETGKEQI